MRKEAAPFGFCSNISFIVPWFVCCTVGGDNNPNGMDITSTTIIITLTTGIHILLLRIFADTFFACNLINLLWL